MGDERAEIQIVLDSLDRSKGLIDGAIKDLNKFDSAVTNSGKSSETLTRKTKESHTAMKGLGEVASDLGRKLIAAFAVEKIIEFTGRALETAKAMEDIAGETGQSLEQVEKWRASFGLAGKDLSTVSRAFGQFSVLISQARDETSDAAGIFRSLGISVKDARGNMLPFEQIIQATQTQFNGWAASADKSANATALFSRNGRAMIEIFQKNAEAAKSADQSVGQFGPTTKEAAEAASEFARSKQQLIVTGEALFRVIGVELVPVFSEFVQIVLQFARSDEGRFAFELVRAAISLVSTTLKVAINDMRGFISTIGSLSQVASSVLLLDFKGATEGVKTMFANAAASTQRDVDAIIGLFDREGQARKKAEDARKEGGVVGGVSPSIVAEQEKLKQIAEQRAEAEAQLAIATANASNDQITGDEKRLKAAEDYLHTLQLIAKQLGELNQKSPAVISAQREVKVQQAQTGAAAVKLYEEQKKNAGKLKEAELVINDERYQGTSQMFGNMAAVAKSFGKEGFAAYQAFAIAQATMDTAKAAIGAYNSTVGIPFVGPIVAPIAAAAAVAFGAMQIAKIASENPGYAEGGYTGDGARSEPAGIVHRGEVVIPQPTVQAYGGPSYFLDRYRLPGYAEGGYVESPPIAQSSNVHTPSSVNMGVSFGIINTRQEMRNFQRRDGTRIIVDQLNRRGNKIVA